MARMRFSRVGVLMFISVAAVGWVERSYARPNAFRGMLGLVKNSTQPTNSPLRNHLADRAGIVRGEKQPPVGNGGDGTRAAIRAGDRVFADDRAVGLHAADPVGEILGEP